MKQFSLVEERMIIIFSLRFCVLCMQKKKRKCSEVTMKNKDIVLPAALSRLFG